MVTKPLGAAQGCLFDQAFLFQSRELGTDRAHWQDRRLGKCFGGDGSPVLHDMGEDFARLVSQDFQPGLVQRRHGIQQPLQISPDVVASTSGKQLI